MTYKLAWVQPNFQQGPKELNAHYLPYSAVNAARRGSAAARGKTTPDLATVTIA